MQQHLIAWLSPDVNPAQIINDRLGKELDQIATDYMRTIPYEVLSKQRAIDLKEELAYEVASRSYIKEVGVTLDRFYIANIVLPESLVKAAEERKAAAEKAKALKTRSEAEADAKIRLGTADATAREAMVSAEAQKPQQVVTNIIDTLSAKFPGLPPDQLAAMAAEIAKTTLAGQSILVQNAGNGMGQMMGTMAAAGSAMGSPRPASTDSSSGSSSTDSSSSSDVDPSELDEIIEGYLDEEGYLNNRKLRVVVKNLRGEDVVGDYQLSDLSPEEKVAVVEKIKELEASKRRGSA